MISFALTKRWEGTGRFLVQQVTFKARIAALL